MPFSVYLVLSLMQYTKDDTEIWSWVNQSKVHAKYKNCQHLGFEVVWVFLIIIPFLIWGVKMLFRGNEQRKKYIDLCGTKGVPEVLLAISLYLGFPVKQKIFEYRCTNISKHFLYISDKFIYVCHVLT